MKTIVWGLSSIVNQLGRLSCTIYANFLCDTSRSCDEHTDCRIQQNPGWSMHMRRLRGNIASVQTNMTVPYSCRYPYQDNWLMNSQICVLFLVTVKAVQLCTCERHQICSFLLWHHITLYLGILTCSLPLSHLLIRSDVGVPTSGPPS